MPRLNYHHLQYFWAVAKDGNLTRAARRMHVSQSALSTQIRQLEEQFEQPLFNRVGRSLQLTEAGHLALAFADSIFASGNELFALLREGRRQTRQVLRVGGVATLSRNFQENFLRPLLARDDVDLVLQSGSLDELLKRLKVHELDLVLANRAVHADSEHAWRCRRIARQAMSLVGRPRTKKNPFRFPRSLTETPLLLPSGNSDARAGFDLICEQHGLTVRVLAEVDDMALLRLLARDSKAVALLPSVVVQDELRSGVLVEYCTVPDLYESFYGITVRRRFESGLVEELLRRSESEILHQVMPASTSARRRP